MAETYLQPLHRTLDVNLRYLLYYSGHHPILKKKV